MLQILFQDAVEPIAEALKHKFFIQNIHTQANPFVIGLLSSIGPSTYFKLLKNSHGHNRAEVYFRVRPETRDLQPY